MDRRTALLLTTLLGAFAPSRLRAQEEGRWASKSKSRPREDAEFRPVAAGDRDDLDYRREAPLDPEAQPPAGFLSEPGFQWRRFPISSYTQVAAEQKTPQKAIIDWIFRRTGTADWHGDKTAVLTASKTELRAYNSPEVLDLVEEVVERFTDSMEDVLALHVQVVAAVDTRWRYSVFSRLEPVGSGPQGQQIWTLRASDRDMVLGQMQVQQGFRRLIDKQPIEVANGQTLSIRTFEPRTYAGGIRRESAAGTGFQPKSEKLEESVVLRISPLLSYDGDAVDAAVDLTVNSVQAFQRTKIIAPREVGPSEMTIDVPVAYQTRLDQTIKNWPLGQTLLISGGVHPGVMEQKGGWLGTGLGAPSSTEILVFLDVEVASRARGRSRGAGEPRAVIEADDDPAPVRTRRPGGRATRGPDIDIDIDEP